MTDTIKKHVIKEIRRVCSLKTENQIHDFAPSKLGWGHNVLMVDVDKQDRHLCEVMVISQKKINKGDIFIFGLAEDKNNYASLVIESKRNSNPRDLYNILVTTRLDNQGNGVLIEQNDRD